MQVLLIVFMAVVMCVTIVTLAMMIADMAKERKAGKAAPAPVAQPEPAPAKAEPVQVVVRTDDDNADADTDDQPEIMEIDPEVAATLSGDNAVVFASAKHETIDDKYAELPSELKKYYDEIVVYAASVDKSKRIKNARYEEYKIGSNRIVRLTIKRGVIVCEYLITNPLFRSYAKENKVSVKQSPTVLKVVDAATLQAAKDSIDLAVNGIAEDKQFKKEMQKAKRRERKEQESADDRQNS